MRQRLTNRAVEENLHRPLELWERDVPNRNGEEPTEAKRSFRRRLQKAFITDGADASAEPVVQASPSAKIISWREAGENALALSTAALLAFGLHYWVFGKSEGEPSRNSLWCAFVTLACIQGRSVLWRSRLRLLAASATVMALIGFHLHYIIGERLGPEVRMLVFGALQLVVWIAADLLVRFSPHLRMKRTQ